MGIGDFIQTLRNLDIYTVGSKEHNSDIFGELDTITTDNIPAVFIKLKNYILTVYTESNLQLELRLQIGTIIKKITVFFVDSIEWGKTYYTIPNSKILGITKFIKDNNLPYSVNQYGFFEFNAINHDIRTYEQLKKKLVYNI